MRCTQETSWRIRTGANYGPHIGASWSLVRPCCRTRSHNHETPHNNIFYNSYITNNSTLRTRGSKSSFCARPRSRTWRATCPPCSARCWRSFGPLPATTCIWAACVWIFMTARPCKCTLPSVRFWVTKRRAILLWDRKATQACCRVCYVGMCSTTTRLGSWAAA